jgi:2-oxoglutarate dehydrogenase complex dehydrogenase (E1) component-like enzyme
VVAVARVEQLYPVPEAELSATLLRYPALKSVMWVQEEPENMGARIFATPYMHALVRNRAEISCIARPASPSPASGSSKVHDAQQEALLSAAFADL